MCPNKLNVYWEFNWSLNYIIRKGILGCVNGCKQTSGRWHTASSIQSKWANDHNWVVSVRICTTTSATSVFCSPATRIWFQTFWSDFFPHQYVLILSLFISSLIEFHILHCQFIHHLCLITIYSNYHHSIDFTLYSFGDPESKTTTTKWF